MAYLHINNRHLCTSWPGYVPGNSCSMSRGNWCGLNSLVPFEYSSVSSTSRVCFHGAAAKNLTGATLSFLDLTLSTNHYFDQPLT
jgi:hypothetical protein